ncbi:MAG: 3-hydroxyacyl-CoA dehydrogenase NAD-binding domain-containing protein [Chitinophagaceae bacterium]|jgi:3-hydroxybutyryl-CoA dehydrogenase|nr:3-hydroxyacyl-CoA dehydrogenase NAD-binding domain-containing protein [Chitinophagaceae bacterium]
MIQQVKDIRNFLILGSGTLGLRVGLRAALSGFDTVIYDIDEAVFAKAATFQDQILGQLQQAGSITSTDALDAKARIRFTTNAEEAASMADFVNESVTEDLAVKKAVWSQFGTLCPPHTLFTTNTSYLLPSWFAAETGRPAQFCAFHFHDVFTANVVDIMPHAQTDPRLVELLTELGKKLLQTPVLVRKESPGYIFNAMLVSLIGAAGALVTGEVSSVEDVDRSWMGNFKMPQGPFGILDVIGLDTAWHVTRNLPDAKSKLFAALLKTYIDQGKLGIKTGEGFYRYPNPSYRNKDFVQG